jgi:hypothetical protein
MSLLLAIQLYVAQILSTNPSHLENAANDAYVGSRVRSHFSRSHFVSCLLTAKLAEQHQPAAGHRVCQRLQATCSSLLHH